MEKKLLERFAKKIAKSKLNTVQDRKGNDKKVINCFKCKDNVN